MVLWLREHPEERGEVALERERARFILGPAAAAPPVAAATTAESQLRAADFSSVPVRDPRP
jgi:hypothetical protein